MSKDTDERLKPTHKVVDIVDRANKKICLTVSRYVHDKRECSYPQVRCFASKQKDKNIQQKAYVCYELEQIIYPLVVWNSVKDKG